jgi:hypothetical protein
MAVPNSFAAFQRLFEDIGDPTLPEPDAAAPEAPESKRPAREERVEKILSIACDAILADLHDNEMLRDAVISSLPNPASKTILLIINPTLDVTEDLFEFLDDHPRIKKWTPAARKLDTGERIRAIKILPVPVDDECTSPDRDLEAQKSQEQSALQNAAEEGDRIGISGTFAGSNPGM